MKRFALRLCAVFFFHLVTFGQGAETTTLTGVVIDDFGAVIPAAKIIAETSKKRRFETSTDQDGIFTLVLEPAIYTIRVVYSPFLPLTIKDYQVASYVKKMTLDMSLICKDCNREWLNSRKKPATSNTKGRPGKAMRAP